MFKKGDLVVCIRKAQFREFEGEVGQLYTVREHSISGLFLNEQSEQWEHNGLDCGRFRLATKEDFAKLNYSPYPPLEKHKK